MFGFNGPDYQGIEKVIFPFKRPDGEYAIMMQFNYAEKPGALAISGHGEGFAGGPPFSAAQQGARGRITLRALQGGQPK